MTKNKILLLVDDEEIIKNVQNISNVTFLFPIDTFSVGFHKTFKIEKIKEKAYIFINRIMDNKTIEDFKKQIKNLPSNILGIVFDDIGILNVLKDFKSLQKILFLNHFNCNYESINAYLDYVDSVVVSPDITIKEIDEILDHVKKDVVLYTFGHVNIMYSRRTLISNYNINFKIIESLYGTVIYTQEPFNALELRNRKKVLFNLVNTVFLKPEEVLNIINTDANLDDIYPYRYLSNTDMIVKLKEMSD